MMAFSSEAEAFSFAWFHRLQVLLDACIRPTFKHGRMERWMKEGEDRCEHHLMIKKPADHSRNEHVLHRVN